MSKVMEGSSLILPVQSLPQRQQVPHLNSSASTPCTTILSSHFQPSRRVRQYSSHSVKSIARHQLQHLLLLDSKVQTGSFWVKHFPSSFHGDARALKQKTPWRKEKLKDAFSFYPSQEPKSTVAVQSFSRPFDESHQPPGNYPSLATQLPTALEPRFPSASVEQSKTRELNAARNLEQSTSSSPLEVVQPGPKARSKPVPTVTSISEHRRSWRAEKSAPHQRAPSPTKAQPGPRFETNYMHGKEIFPRSSDSNPNSGKQIEARVKSKNVSHEVVGGVESRQRNTDSLKVELERVGYIKASLTRSVTANAVLEIRESQPLSREEGGEVLATSEEGLTENSVRPDLRTEELPRKALWMDGGSTPARRLQPRASFGSRDWSRDTAQRNGHTHMHGAGTTREAIAILRNRLQRGITVDSYMYVDVLRRCSKQKDLLTAKQVHDCVIQSGMDKNPHVASSLVNMYIQCGQLLEARRVFDELEKKSVIIWTRMIAGYAKYGHTESAFEVFNQLRQEGLRPDEITYLSILKAFTSPLSLKCGKEVHECIRNSGFELDVRVGTALLKMYAECGCLTEARPVFENLTNRNVITWNVMIGAYAERGHCVEAYQLFLQMRREGFEPDAFTYTSMLNASASAGPLEWVKEVHGHAIKAGLESNLRVGTALVHIYAKSGSIDEARLVFGRMEKRDVVTWTAMIGGLAQHGCGHEAYRLFLQMQREGFEPDAFTYASMLNASASAGALEWVKEVHSHATKAGLESDLRVANALVHMYAESGSIDLARRVFDTMEKRNAVTWTTMIGGLAHHGCGHEAYQLFLQMRRSGFEPDAITYMSILNASASAGALEWVKEVHVQASQAGLESDSRVGNALIHMYAESGSIDDARRVFDRMEKLDVVTWNAMIGGLAQHGCGHEALALFRKMNADGVKPDRYSFVAVLSACSHGGLLDAGRNLFSAMTQDYGIEPDIVHYTCMVDLLGRAGHLEEAKRFISEMPVEPVLITWTALLGACRSYGNVELGELAANELFKLEPSTASTYVLLSNIYAAAGKWEKVSLVRTMMVTRGVRKEPGRSSIEVDNKIHEFVVGDTSHPEAKAIYTELNKLTQKLKAEGYIPHTRLVLHDINEEDKEVALFSHSEKLAIAYGLMHIRRGEPIRVRKNLRVCSDCHTATKLISKVTGREIIARDTNRFHHFKDGLCSCGDYW